MEKELVMSSPTYKYNILCATDNNYALQCGVMIYSLFYNHVGTSDIVVHIIDDNISDENKHKLRSIAWEFRQEICFHDIDNGLLKGLKLQGDTYVSPIVYYRLFVSRILDEMISRVLYLDCDVMVLKDIAPLFQLNMEGHTIAAVRDVNQPMWEEQAFQIGFSYHDRYFNSGVILINLDKWRQDNVEERLYVFSCRERKVFFPDQDALNYVFRDKWLELPPKWNRFNLVRYNQVTFKNKKDFLDYVYCPAIVHFASKTARPWMRLKFVPFGKKYEEYCSLTPWKKYCKQKVEKRQRYISMVKYWWVNVLYRSPLLIRIVFVSVFESFLIIYHLLRHHSFRYYKVQTFKE